MKNEPAQSQDILRPVPLPLVKLLSLATVAWGVLGHGWFNMLGAAWVVWMVLALLIFLDASACESRRATWGQASAIFVRIIGPGILPFYGALCVLLAVGPSYVRQTPGFSLPPQGRPVPSQLNQSSVFTPNASFAPKPASVNAPGFSSTPPRPFKRPNTAQGPATSNAGPQAASNPKPAVNPAATKPVSPTPTPAAGTPTPFIIQPNGSARPTPAPPK